MESHNPAMFQSPPIRGVFVGGKHPKNWRFFWDFHGPLYGSGTATDNGAMIGQKKGFSHQTLENNHQT